MAARAKAMIAVAFLLSLITCAAVRGEAVVVRQSLVSQKPILHAGRTSGPPVIDGKLDDRCWQDASVASGFISISGFWAQEQTTTYVTYDDACLYIVFRCNEPAPEKIATGTRSNDVVDIFSDNSVELFLDTKQDRRTYYHLAVNSLGARYEAYVDAGKEFRNVDWNPDWEVKTRIGIEQWTAEMRIPFASLETTCPQPGTCWGLSLTRSRPSGGGIESTSWAMMKGSFNQPMDFGQLVFGGCSEVSYSVISLRVRPEGNELRIRLRNGRDSSLTVRTEWSIDTYAQTATVRLRPNEEEETCIKSDFLPQTTTGIFELALAVVNTKTGEICDFRKGLWKLPPPSPLMEMSLDRYYYTSEDQPVRIGFARKTKDGDSLEVEISRNLGEEPVISQHISLVPGKDNYDASFDIAGWKAGRYVVSAHLLGKDREKLSSAYRVFIKKNIEPAITPSPVPRVSIRSDGIILLDEKPFCPFFTCEAPQKNSLTQDCFNVRYGDIGLVSRPLERLGVGLPAPVREYTWNGNNVFTLLPEEKEMLEKIRNVVTARKTDPLLLYWFMSYEADVIPMCRGRENRVHLNNAEELRKISRFVKTVDPQHLTAIHLDPGGDLLGYRDSADIIEVAVSSSYANFLIPNLVKDVVSVRETLGQNKPFLLWIGCSVPTAERRTAEEIRCASYLALMHGATGIVFHIGDGSISPSFTRLWSVYTGLSREVEKLFPIVTASCPSRGPIITIHSTGIDYCVREYNNRLYLVAANTLDAVVDAKISIVGAPDIAKRVNVLFEDRGVDLAGPGFTDVFTAFEPHVYEFSAREQR